MNSAVGITPGKTARSFCLACRRDAEMQPDHPAVVASGFGVLSYRELYRLIDEVRAALRQAGFGGSARIAVAMQDGSQAALATVAVVCSA